MPAIGEMGSAARSRVRSQEPPVLESDSVDSEGFESSGGGSEGFELKEDPSFWKDHNVQVVIRIRPLSSTEISLQGNNKCVRQESCQTVTWTGHPESRFTFDLVADEHVSQEKLFKVAGVPMVENCVSGYNSCMFAYGQTGSGKTHTMLGDIEGGTRRHSVNCGMTPRVFEYMFSRIQKEKEARRDEKIRFTCKCSFLEIYNEQILDLLDPSSANLQIREDAKKGVHVENLTEFEVSSARDVMQQLIQGAANRKVAATNMNRASSRSHSVFTCVIESKWEAQGVTHHRFARLNLVDLAGSERQKSSGAEGDRLKEATNINKSLSTLGLVIMNLVSSSNKKPMHVPYRDSKLTFLLQDSLGGNSKTIIIANISPSNCCALETLSTLKFAQRAKFIRNNAVVNEDASGDVLAMRMQIQQLKKEVNRLQGLLTGGTENFGCDSLSALHPVSPGNFRWDGVQGSFSPLTFDKRLSQKKEYEAALVAAFRREQDKEAALKALAAGKQSAEQLANQRTEEVRSLKMRLRFREEGIKRLEAINSGKLSAETHFLQEREELLKEIEVLRNQVDRNPEVTRFAMENLQLKEELRRLQAFVEEGEQEMLNGQIAILQDKLLEALDWKLMHENETKDRLSLTWETSDNEENEFLRLQAIQNQREIEALRKNLTFCLEAKEKLERRVDELVSQLKEQRSSFDAPNLEIQDYQNNGPVSAEANGSTDDQLELKTMVDAIAAASQREAEAHETAIMLAKENEELRKKIKVLIEDNNHLIELYDGVVAGGTSNQPDTGLQINHTREHANNSADYTANGHKNSNCENYYQETRDIEHLQHQLHEMHEENEKLLGLYEKAMQEKEDRQVDMDVEHLQHQLHEMHEENDKLLGLYEKAMQEKDELKKLLSSYDFHDTEAKEEIKCEEEHVHMDDGRDAEKQNKEKLEELLALYERVVQERDEFKRNLSFYELNSAEAKDEKCEGKPIHMDDEIVIQMHEREKLEELPEEKLCLVRNRLDQAQDQLEAAGKAVKYFGLLEKATFEVDELRDTIEVLNQTVQLKQQELNAVRSIFPITLERRTVVENKFLALKVALQNVSSKVQYWDKREEQAREKVKMCSGPLEQKKEELRHLKIRKDEADSARMRARLSESELRDNIASLKLKYQAAEAQKKETERVLFAIDNNPDISLQRTTNFGKASEMLKSEEEKSKISAEIKQQRERLATVMKEIADSKRISEALDSMIQSLEAGIECGMRSLQEAELRLMDVLSEKQALSEMREDGMESELSKILLEYQECIFESDMKEEEIKLLDEALHLEERNLEESTAKQLFATHKLNYLLGESRQNLMLSNSDKCSRSVSEKIEIELGDVQKSLADAKSLLLSVR